MKICQPAVAGTYESSDLFVDVEPSETFSVTVTSSATQFRDAVEKTVLATLAKMNVSEGEWQVTDSGALDCIIVARVQAAAQRAAAVDSLPWEKM